MRVLMISAAYTQRGGEDVSLEVDAQLLRDHGHEVVVKTWPNSALGKLEAAARQVWSNAVYREVMLLVAREQPDVVDCANTSWALGPAAIAALHDAGVPICARLNNERLRFGVHDLITAPYNGSRLQSLPLVFGNALHRKWTWARKVDRFMAVSRYIKARMEEAGLTRISVRGDTVCPVPEFSAEGSDRFLFVGRICPEKGVPVLLEAWRNLPDLQLDVVGRLDAQPREQVGVTWRGALPHTQVLDMMAKARAVIVPSVWPEPSGRVALEAMACGTPVIASSAGGLSEGRPVITVLRDSVDELRKAVCKVASWAPDEVVRQRLIARATWAKWHSPERQLDGLIGSYQMAIAHRIDRKRGRFGELNDPATRKHLARFNAARSTK